MHRGVTTCVFQDMKHPTVFIVSGKASVDREGPARGSCVSGRESCWWFGSGEKSDLG